MAIGAEHVEVTVLMVPDRTPKPFALPRRVWTEEGRAWARSLVAELRGIGIGVVHDFGDGVITARIPRGRVENALHSLERHPRVERVLLKPEAQTFMDAEALDLLGLQATQSIPPGAYLLPFAGAPSEEVVIIDVAFDRSHPALVNHPNLFEYCACGSPSAPCCGNGLAFQQGAGLGLVAPPNNGLAAFYHGTTVASVVAGAPDLSLPLGPSSPDLPPALPGLTTQGAARHAALHLINVQDRSTSPPGWDISSTLGGLGANINEEGVLTALQQVLSWRNAGRPIRSVNMSFGLSVPCGSTGPAGPIYSVVNQLRQAGVVVVAASGNFGNVPTQVPGCIPEAVTVAATEHPAPGRQSFNASCFDGLAAPGNQITCYSVVDGNVDLAATSNMRLPTAERIGTSVLHRQSNQGGTSFAAPVAAACAAQIASTTPAPFNPAGVESAMVRGPQWASRCALGDIDCLAKDQLPLLNCAVARSKYLAGDTALPINQVGLSGTYYSPSLEGQGMMVDVIFNATTGPTPHLLFAGWYTYTLPSEPGGTGQQWYVFSGSFSDAPNEVIGKIYRTNFIGHVPAFGQPLFGRQLDPVADAVVRFRSCTDMEMEYHNSSEFNVPPLPALRRPIIKLSRPLGAPRCQNASGILGGAQDSRAVKCTPVFPNEITGTWQVAQVNGSEWTKDLQHEGRGFIIEGNSGFQCSGGYLFGAWYDYAGAGDPSIIPRRPRWFSFSSCGDASRVGGPGSHVFQLYLTLTHGGERLVPYPNPEWNSHPATPQQCPATYGAHLTFHDCNRATLSYDFGMAGPQGFGGIVGQTGTIHLIRSVQVQGCQLP